MDQIQMKVDAIYKGKLLERNSLQDVSPWNISQSLAMEYIQEGLAEFYSPPLLPVTTSIDVTQAMKDYLAVRDELAAPAKENTSSKPASKRTKRIV